MRSSMLGWVAPVRATESPSQLKPQFSQRTCTTDWSPPPPRAESSADMWSRSLTAAAVGEGEVEGGADPLLALQPDATPVQLHVAVHDGQAHPGPPSSRRLVGRLEEALEDALLEVEGDARALVVHADHDMAVALGGPDPHRGAPG